MRKIVPVFAVLLVLALLLSVGTQVVRAADKSDTVCPWWLPEAGTCLTDFGQVQIEDVPVTLDSTGITTDLDWQPDRWLLSVRQDVPTPSVIFGFNLNKWHLEQAWVFVDLGVLVDPPVDEGDMRNGYYVETRLVCDAAGTTNPTLALSIPVQKITLASGSEYLRYPINYRLGVVNWIESIFSPCRYY